VIRPAERREQPSDPGDRLDLDARGLADVPLEPPDAHPSRACPVVERDEHDELERVAELDLASLAERELGRYDVTPLDRPLEDRAAVSVLAHQASTWLGPGGEASVAFALSSETPADRDNRMYQANSSRALNICTSKRGRAQSGGRRT
jgi:hypothetical protein